MSSNIVRPPTEPQEIQPSGISRGRAGRDVVVGTLTARGVLLGHRDDDRFASLTGVILETAEKIGVETEHEYLFKEVKKKIEGAK